MWIHKWGSGVRGDLSLVVDGIRCKRCDGRTQEADLGVDLVIEGETYGGIVICETLEILERILLQ